MYHLHIPMRTCCCSNSDVITKIRVRWFSQVAKNDLMLSRWVQNEWMIQYSVILQQYKWYHWWKRQKSGNTLLLYEWSFVCNTAEAIQHFKGDTSVFVSVEWINFLGFCSCFWFIYCSTRALEYKCNFEWSSNWGICF